jgi:hypothetical protein
MNTKNLLISALVGGVVTEILTNVPVVSLLTCVFCVSFWIGPLLAVWLYRRMQGEVSLGQAVGIGALAGVIAGVIGFILSFFNLAGVGDLSQALRPMAQNLQISEEDLKNIEAMTTGPMLIVFNMIGVGVTIAFGAVGGLIGGAIFKTRPAAAINPPSAGSNPPAAGSL